MEQVLSLKTAESSKSSSVASSPSAKNYNGSETGP